MTQASPSHELQLILASVRATFDRGVRERMAQPLCGSLDGDHIDCGRLLALSHWHGVMPLLREALLDACPEHLPPPLVEALTSDFRAHSQRSLVLTQTLLRLLTALDAAGIPAVPLKGPALAASVYGDITRRECLDLDILVPREHAVQARDTLVALGYRAEGVPGDRADAALLAFDTHCTLRGSEVGALVELRWTLHDTHLPMPISLEPVWGRLASVPLGGGVVSALSPEDTVLFLCVHGAGHCWERLKWVCDLGWLARAQTGLAWDRLLATAGTLRLRRVVALGLLLARDVLAAPVPDEIVNWAARVAGAADMANGAARRLQGDTLAPLSGLARIGCFARCYDRRCDRVTFLLRRALSPSQRDRSFLALPRSLLPGYYPLRPIRLAVDGAKALTRRIGA